jgi:hypothetical protein
VTSCQATSSFCCSRRWNRYGGLPAVRYRLTPTQLRSRNILALSLSSAIVVILWQSVSHTATMNTAAITSEMSARFTDPRGTIPRKLDNEQETQMQTETSRTVCIVTRIILVMRFTEQIPSWDAYNLPAHVTLRHIENANVHYHFNKSRPLAHTLG